MAKERHINLIFLLLYSSTILDVTKIYFILYFISCNLLSLLKHRTIWKGFSNTNFDRILIKGEERRCNVMSVDSLFDKAHSPLYCCVVLLDPRISPTNNSVFGSAKTNEILLVIKIKKRIINQHKGGCRTIIPFATRTLYCALYCGDKAK